MAIKDLREFMALLESRGQLSRVSAELDPVLEIGEVTDRVSKKHGPGLVFEKPVDRETGRSYTMPVAINLFGSYDRMAWAMGVDAETGTWKDLDAVGKRLMDLLPLDMPASMKGKLDALLGLKDLAGAGAKEVKKAPVQEVILRGDEVDLGILPVLKTWPEDGGRFITLPLVVTANLKGKLNLGMYRLQIFDKNTTGMHIHEHHDGAKNMREQFAAGVKRVPVSVALGADPVTIFSATAPVPPIIDEYLFSGIVRGEAVEVVKCITNDLLVPAHAEIVLEGYVEAGETRWEGPFGDHTGYYSLADDFPVFHVEAITMRKDAIYPATIVGRPPMEDCYLGKATERLFLPIVKAMMPEVLDYDLPLEGVFHNCAIFQIKKEFAGQAFRVMNFAWSMGQMMFTKFVIVVDADVDCHDYSQVAWRCFNNVDPSRDILISKGPLDRLDHSSTMESFGYKMGIDATKPLANEGHDRGWPDALEMSPEVKQRVDSMWGELGL
ncbi:MAG: menaquinone biosynthesis decarboxylase [Actinomycetota bacterium]|nr:MAG: 3-octaprenyl-4-hydroxybenzoate carboxy-lyase [Actinomycetota bacterium]MDO8950157.1 menaquinone biosynthesis decarboxylase [Actinomycetota bacterium]MDP3630478.1 menaquinone biosynthesis decarboxylase [Actinomycetota bacterium]